jgi:hypothetical protein
MSLLLKCTTLHGILLLVGCIWLAVIFTIWKEIELQESCVEGWESWICSVGNLSGLCSTVFWSFVMVPQIWHNYKRKSTDGLSLRWAFANVAAALINLNFVLRIHVPLYITISAIYMPVLEVLILLQFTLFSHNCWTRVISCSLFVVLLILTVAFSVFWNHISTDVSGAMMWGAVVLWSIETFPQLWLNAHRQSTTGQASQSITIAFLGKTTDFISMVSLNLPTQFRIMTYFSTCSSYANVVQFLYYRNSKSPATLVSILIVTCSFAMMLKIGILYAGVVAAVFATTLFGGYQLEKRICPNAGSGCCMDDSKGAMEEYEADVGDLSENLLTSDEKESTPVITWWN